MTAGVLMVALGSTAAAAWAQGGDAVEFDYAFDDGPDGWTAGFADLPVDWDQSIFELDHRYGPLPDGLDGNGICLQGHNRSDDLFMFLKRHVTGLQPKAVYGVAASVDLATNVPSGSIGIGGSPGESVFVKIGASGVEPVPIEGRNQHLRLNIDKGNQSRGGSDMAVVGHVAHSEVIDDEYRIKTLDTGGIALTARSDENGRLWLIVGTDSGFEGLSRLCYSRISYTLNAEDDAATEPTEPAGTTPSTEPADTAAPDEPESAELGENVPAEPDDTAAPDDPVPAASEGAGWPAWATVVIAVVIAAVLAAAGRRLARRSRSR